MSTGETRKLEAHMVQMHGDWKKPSRVLYRCKVIILPEENITSVYAATLPGVASQGHSEKEALANIVAAIEGALAIYKENSQEIPWTEQPTTQEKGAQIRWVFVHG